ncbi:hypothetical protein [Streptosporangium sp. NPDC051022]|uniref:hypothetical protein n=1 Tax=Streptosporangium sp. NPDC051022 TaxID=3155752 RepID=UPI00341837DB
MASVIFGFLQDTAPLRDGRRHLLASLDRNGAVAQAVPGAERSPVQARGTDVPLLKASAGGGSPAAPRDGLR